MAFAENKTENLGTTFSLHASDGIPPRQATLVPGPGLRERGEEVHRWTLLATSSPGSPTGLACEGLDGGVQTSLCSDFLRGASGRHSARGKGHEEGGWTYAKAGSSLRSPPGNSRASTPQNQSLPTLLLCALTYTSDFTGGCPPPPLSEKELTYSSS